jgi:ribose transport system permease protein
VTEVREETVEVDERETRVTVLKIDREPRGGGYGQISKVLPIVDYGDEGTRVHLAGETPRVRPRDQIMFVHAERAGFKRVPVESAQTEDGNTVVTLEDSFRGTGSDESSSGWYAVVEHRRQRMPVFAALALVLLVAIGLGLLHGVLVTWLKVQPFVVTLCGLLFYRGISRWLVNDQPVGFGNEYHTLRQLGRGKLALWQSAQGADVGIPYPFFILLAVAVVAAIFLNKTIWGRYMLALGRNEEAARYSGINTSRMIMIAYVISTSLAAVGGILFALDSNSISPSSFGNFFELYAIAAAVLGGCSLRGGEGTISGVIIGTAVMRVLNNLIILMKISDTLEFAIIGMVILLGVIADELIKRYAATRQRKAQARAG